MSVVMKSFERLVLAYLKASTGHLLDPLILTRHLLIRRTFREKCIFTDYNERVFLLLLLFSLSSNLKLSIDIYIMSVMHVFADFQLILVKGSYSR